MLAFKSNIAAHPLFAFQRSLHYSADQFPGDNEENISRKRGRNKKKKKKTLRYALRSFARPFAKCMAGASRLGSSGIVGGGVVVCLRY